VPEGPKGPDLLVTGTDTGVGKTMVAAALILALRERGVRALGFKPAETGVGPAEPSDSALLAEASGVAEPLASPLLSLEEPLAPAMAADRAGVFLEPSAVEGRLRALRLAGYTVVVEGAGGVAVPLAWGYTALDLAARTGLHVIVVARAGLGTLNHVALTIEALRAREIVVRGVVLNGPGVPPDLAETTNPDAMLKMIPGLPIVTLPRFPEGGLAAARAAAALLGAWA